MKKREYIKPIIEQIDIDNQISVLMVTNPPTGPGEETDPFAFRNNSSGFPDAKLPSSGYGANTPFGGSTPDYQ